MKNLPKINPAKAVKASLPYVFAGLLCTTSSFLRLAVQRESIF